MAEPTKIDFHHMLEKLKKVKEFFHGLSELELDFWDSILSTKGKHDILKHDDKGQTTAVIAGQLKLDVAFVKEIYDSINYEDYSSIAKPPQEGAIMFGL